MYFDSELGLHVLYYLLIQSHNLVACSSTTVYQHKRLTVVNPCPTERTALPSALLNHPSGRNLDMLLVNYIMRHTIVLCCKALVHVAVHNGIHEEAACIAHNLRVGQLCLAYFDDGLAQLFGSRSCYALAFERMADVAVVEIGGEGAREAIGDMRNEELVFHSCLNRL